MPKLTTELSNDLLLSDSQFERDFPSYKEAEHGRKPSSEKTNKKTTNFHHSFLKKESLSNTTGRNNFDKLLFSSNQTRENKYNSKTSTPFTAKIKKQPQSSHIIFDDDDESLFSFSKLESDFKFGFTDFDSQVSDKKRKVKSEVVSASKKQKVSDSEKKKNKKRNFERDNTDSPKRSKLDEEDSLGTISVTFATRNISITDRPSKRRQKQDSFKKKKGDVVDKRMKGQSYIERDTFRDEINVTVSNKEKDFPRGGKKKKDSFRDEISVSFKNNLAKSGNERKSERGFIKTKKFESVVTISDDSSEEIDHQVYNNEWWLKKNGKKNKRKNRKKH